VLKVALNTNQPSVKDDDDNDNDDDDSDDDDNDDDDDDDDDERYSCKSSDVILLSVVLVHLSL